MNATGGMDEAATANGPAGLDNALLKLKETVDAVLRRLPAPLLVPRYGIAYVTAPWWQNNPAAGLARESSLPYSTFGLGPRFRRSTLPRRQRCHRGTSRGHRASHRLCRSPGTKPKRHSPLSPIAGRQHGRRGMAAHRVRPTSVGLLVGIVDAGSNHGSVGNDGVLWDDDDAVTNVIKGMVYLVGLAFGADHDVVSNARILVDDRVFNVDVFANT